MHRAVRWLLDYRSLDQRTCPTGPRFAQLAGTQSDDGSPEAADSFRKEVPSDHQFTYHFSSASGHVAIVFVRLGRRVHGRWRTSTIERSGDDPVVRGTVITGVLREQCWRRALDGPTERGKGEWTSFALWLLGQDPQQR